MNNKVQNNFIIDFIKISKITVDKKELENATKKCHDKIHLKLFKPIRNKYFNQLTDEDVSYFIYETINIFNKKIENPDQGFNEASLYEGKMVKYLQSIIENIISDYFKKERKQVKLDKKCNNKDLKVNLKKPVYFVNLKVNKPGVKSADEKNDYADFIEYEQDLESIYQDSLVLGWTIKRHKIDDIIIRDIYLDDINDCINKLPTDDENIQFVIKKIIEGYGQNITQNEIAASINLTGPQLTARKKKGRNLIILCLNSKGWDGEIIREMRG